ncbi:peptidylprolyl isomerase [Actinomadura graeca]|uniref:Peptidylprolyl isomerase n=1 Tax=Actinomadura graeca TaxID=2750812 RepID=A0ABX8QWQ3_9ACTN|nr:peptidylprolyl isomerase [Actinomadura graeca]QXJ23195.1 peptidylprolyl isomerase [Actinomadura graeca]
MPDPRPLRPNDPTEVGGFRLTGRIGEGGQGTVYAGESDTGERVAVKLLHADFEGDEQARLYFERELATARQVAPFCTARIIAARADGEAAYIVSEYIDGPSLRQLVAERGVLPAGELDRLAIGTATALAAIHEAGVVHRDFKPANVLLGEDGPKVIDFGVARPQEATYATLTGAVGTPAYMAPEQVAGTSGGPPLDMFAWGCTMAYAANRVPPFGHDSIPATMHRILHAEPELGALGGDLRELVTACLDKDPGRRPTAVQVLTRLLDLGTGGDLLAEGTSAAATLTPAVRTVPAPPPPPGLQAPAPGPVIGDPTGPRTVPAPSFGRPPAPPGRRGRVLAVTGAAAGVVLLAAATTAAVLIGNGADGKGSGHATSGGSSAAVACAYLPADGPELKDVGKPPANPPARGLVRATVTTNLGTIEMELDGAKAPCTVNSIVYLAVTGFYNDTSCHRLSTNASLKVLQCGDPSDTGTGGPAYRFPTENTAGARYDRGVVAMARAESPVSNGSQFFILYGDSPSLPPSYTVFGRVTSGMRIIDDVAAAGVAPGASVADDGTPKKKITITAFRTVPA